MTTLADNTIDRLMKRTREKRGASEFVFAAEYPPRELPNPISKYVVTVGNTSTRVKRRFVGERPAQNTRGVLYETVLRLRMYAPENSSASALLRASSLLADAVEQADCDRIVQDVALSPVVYDATARTVYRDVTVTVWLLLSEEVQDD